MLILEIRCNKCGAHGAKSLRSEHGNLKGHQIRAIAKSHGWHHEGRHDWCPLCWPVHVAEQKHLRESVKGRT